MIRNLIIILLSAGIVAWSVYVLKGRKYLSKPTKTIASIIFVIWLATIGIPNIPVLLAPLSPPIHGSVVDAKTGKLIINCNIKAYWEIEELIFPGVHRETYQQYTTKTDAQGIFNIPRRLKVLSIYGLFPIIADHYDGIWILAYTHGYSYSRQKINQSQQRGSLYPVDVTIKMGRHTPEHFTDDIYNLEFELTKYPGREGTKEDENFLLEDVSYNYSHFNNIFQYATFDQIKSALIYFASSFSTYGDNNKAIEIYKRLKYEYPESTGFANREIEQLQRNIKNSGVLK